MVEFVWGLPTEYWTAIGSISAAAAAAGAFGAALISFRSSQANLALSRRIHRESGALPVLTVWNEQTSSSDPAEQSTTHIFKVRVENQGRIKCAIQEPVVDRNKDGHLILVDPRFKFSGPGEASLEPSEHQDWTLDLSELPKNIPATSPVRIHVATVWSGGGYLRTRVILNGSRRFRDRWPLLFP